MSPATSGHLGHEYRSFRTIRMESAARDREAQQRHDAQAFWWNLALAIGAAALAGAACANYFL